MPFVLSCLFFFCLFSVLCSCICAVCVLYLFFVLALYLASVLLSPQCNKYLLKWTGLKYYQSVISVRIWDTFSSRFEVFPVFHKVLSQIFCFFIYALTTFVIYIQATYYPLMIATFFWRLNSAAIGWRTWRIWSKRRKLHDKNHQQN